MQMIPSVCSYVLNGSKVEDDIYACIALFRTRSDRSLSAYYHMSHAINSNNSISHSMELSGLY